MKLLHVHRVVDAPGETLWELLTDLAAWPRWGPTVRSARLDAAEFETGATGTVTTVLGVTLPFEITECDPGERWAWKVAGVRATVHTVEAVDESRSRVGFGVPWPAAPYLAVCRLALGRLDLLAASEVAR